MSATYELPEYSAILALLDSVLSQINVGLLIYHQPDGEDDPERLRLIYSNAEASRCTGADLTRKIGSTILEAFPSLKGTDLPATYLDVVKTGKARRLGTVSYGDDQLDPRTYSVKAFPMPHRCVGVLFEAVGGPSLP